MSDIQVIVYKWLLCRIRIEKGSYMDQHNTLSSPLQGVRRTANPNRATVQHLRINHCGFHILVTQKLLQRTDIRSAFQQMGCE